MARAIGASRAPRCRARAGEWRARVASDDHEKVHARRAPTDAGHLTTLAFEGRVSGLHTPRAYRLRALNTRGSEGDGPRLAARRDGEAAVRPREPRARHHAAWRGWRTLAGFPARRRRARPRAPRPRPGRRLGREQRQLPRLHRERRHRRRRRPEKGLQRRFPPLSAARHVSVEEAAPLERGGRDGQARVRDSNPHPRARRRSRSLTAITAATVKSATGPARPESPEDPRRRPRDDDGDSRAPTPEGGRRRGDAPPAPPRTDASRS